MVIMQFKNVQYIKGNLKMAKAVMLKLYPKLSEIDIRLRMNQQMIETVRAGQETTDIFMVKSLSTLQQTLEPTMSSLED